MDMGKILLQMASGGLCRYKLIARKRETESIVLFLWMRGYPEANGDVFRWEVAIVETKQRFTVNDGFARR